MDVAHGRNDGPVQRLTHAVHTDVERVPAMPVTVLGYLYAGLIAALKLVNVNIWF
jgi:hypothetical protein